MNFHKSKLLLIPIALLTTISLAGCGNSTESQQKSIQPVKTTKLTYKNINGGNQDLSNYTAVHSAHGLNRALHTNRIKTFKVPKEHRKKGQSKYEIRRVIKPKAILINSSLNGSSNDTLQNKEQNEENRIGNKIDQLKQKPQISNNSISGMSKQEKQSQQKRIQRQWQNQKKEARQYQKLLNQKQKKYQQLDKQRTQAVTIHVPSNTTIVGAPNIQMQNLTLNLQGKNIILKNLNMQAPNNYGKNNSSNIRNDSVYMSHVNGVKLQHDTFTDSTVNANQSVTDNRRNNANRKQNAKGKKKNNEDQNADSLTDIANGSRHVEIISSRYTNAHKAIYIGNIYNGSSIKEPQVRISHNFFEDVGQDAPQVVNGHVSMHSNYYSEDNKKPYQFNYAFLVGRDASIFAHKDTFNIHGVSGKNMAKKLIKAQNGKPCHNIKDSSININNKDYHYLIQDHSLQVQIPQDQTLSLNKPLPVNHFYSDGSILGEGSALS